MANSTWHFYFPLLISLILLCLTCDNVNSQIEAKPWYETLPAVAMDYKVHIDAGKEDCYYQYVQAGATFYVSFQVKRKFCIFYCCLQVVYTFYIIFDY